MNTSVHHFHTVCPVVGRTTERFVEAVSVGGEICEMEYRREIVWLLESESRVRFLHGGKEVTEGSCWNDYYGFLRSADGDKMSALASSFQITCESSLELRLETTVLLRPCFESNDAKGWNTAHGPEYRRQFAYLPDGWRQLRVEGDERLWRRLEAAVVEKMVTWASFRSESENAAVIAAMRARYECPGAALGALAKVTSELVQEVPA